MLGFCVDLKFSGSGNDSLFNRGSSYRFCYEFCNDTMIFTPTGNGSIPCTTRIVFNDLFCLKDREFQNMFL